ncbi:MAG: hypothetical protein RR140_00605 [Clostridia bacterium]
MFTDAIIQVLAIIGIVLAGGFLVFFIGDIVISIFDGKGFRERRQKTTSENARVANKQVKANANVSAYVPLIEEKSKESSVSVSNKPQTELKEEKSVFEQELERLKNKDKQIEMPLGKSSFDNLREEEEKFRAERLKDIEERRNNIIKQDEKSVSKDDEEINLDDIIFDDNDFNFDNLDLKEENKDNKIQKEENQQISMVNQEIQNAINLLKEEVAKHRSEIETMREEAQQERQSLLDQLGEDNKKQRKEIEQLIQTVEEIKAEKQELQQSLENQKELLLAEKARATQKLEIIDNTSDKQNQEVIAELKQLNGHNQAEIDRLKTELKHKEDKTEQQFICAQIEDITKNSNDEQEKLMLELKKRNAELEMEKAKLEEEYTLNVETSEVERNQILIKLKQKDDELQTKEKQLDTIASTAVEVGSNLTVAEYSERLEMLQERLKANEKEFKICKREYLPLNRVRKSLERDRKKLNRRDIMVATQKVILYGVNNIVDIDEEKVKKLQDDLDLLEGLRLSVQHCEDVIKQNADRIPILEKTYNILKNQNKDLKLDIAECEKALKDLNEEGK